MIYKLKHRTYDLKHSLILTCHLPFTKFSAMPINNKNSNEVSRWTLVKHTRVLGTSSKSVKGSKPCWVTNTIFCSGRWWNIPISFWQAETITSSDSSVLKEPTNLLNSTAYNIIENKWKYKSKAYLISKLYCMEVCFTCKGRILNIWGQNGATERIRHKTQECSRNK